VEKNTTFDLVGEPADLTFKAHDPSLSPATRDTRLSKGESSIVDMLCDKHGESQFVSSTTEGVFDLEGATYPNHDTIQLSSDVPQPDVGRGHKALGTYRRRKMV